jgi:hypothetical protein
MRNVVNVRVERPSSARKLGHDLTTLPHERNASNASIGLRAAYCETGRLTRQLRSCAVAPSRTSPQPQKTFLALSAGRRSRAITNATSVCGPSRQIKALRDEVCSRRQTRLDLLQERHASRRQSPGGGGAECTVVQTAVAPRKDQRTATTSTADIPRRSRPRAVGFVRPLKCSVT